MIRTVTCLVVECNGCGTSVYDDDDSGIGTPHFSTAEEAHKYLKDWTFGTDQHLCPECTVKVQCDAEGHDWEDWLQCSFMRDGQPLREHLCVERRYCQRAYCRARDERDQVVPTDHEMAA